MAATPGIILRGVRLVRRDGIGPALRRVAESGRRLLLLREEHVWYALALDGGRPRPALADGVDLVRAGADQVGLVAGLGRGALGVEVARAYRAGGNDLWLAIEGGEAIFGCWVFRSSAPALAAPDGWLDLPPGVVCLEDSMTTPAARGRGIAPAAWARIADSLLAEDVASMVTKVEVENRPSRKAVEKAGFQEVGRMTLVRVGPRKRVKLFAQEQGEVVGHLADGLGITLSTPTP